MISALTIHVLDPFLSGLFEGGESNISRARGSAESDDYFKVKEWSRKLTGKYEGNCENVKLV